MSMMLALALQAAASGAGADCQAALGPVLADDGTRPTPAIARVDGGTLPDVAALVRLRAARGTAPIVVGGGSFARADFRQARLANICFDGTDLTGSDWRGVAAPGMAFVNADLEGADMTGARLPRVLLRQTNLLNVRAEGADLSGGLLDGGWDGSVEGWQLGGANLRGFRFDCGITVADGCPLDRAMRLPRADLTGASVATFDGHGSWDWTGTRIDRTEISLRQLSQIDRADLRGPILVRGGDTIVTLSPAEYRRVRAAIVTPAEADRPSFDCARASRPVERAICSQYAHRARELDREVATLFAAAQALDPSVATAQRAWLRDRDRCGSDVACVERSYEARKGALLGRRGPPAALRPGARMLFIVPDLRFAPAFQGDLLYRRLLPALVSGAGGRIAVRVNADGTLDAGGDAVGGNAHLCSLAGQRLRFDPANGYYSGPRRDDADTPAAWRNRPMPVVRFMDDWVEVHQGGHSGASGDPRPSDYASCGARASFEPMIRVPAEPAEVDRLLATLGEP